MIKLIECADEVLVGPYTMSRDYDEPAYPNSNGECGMVKLYAYCDDKKIPLELFYESWLNGYGIVLVKFGEEYYTITEGFDWEEKMNTDVEYAITNMLYCMEGIATRE